MAEKQKQWGHCQHCKYFGSFAQLPVPNEEARCNQPDLVKFDLRVFGASGCRAFELRAGFDPGVEVPRAQPRV